MFSFFVRRKQYGLEWMATDMHSHILPGIDDGCPDVETSVHCLEGLRELGLTTFFCTPHIYSGVHPNTPDSIHQSWRTLGQHMEQEKISGITVHPAAEYMVDEQFGEYYHNTVPMLIAEKYLLFEFSFVSEPLDAANHIFQLQLQGLTPIWAHPERYAYYHKNRNRIRKMREAGCLLQINLLSLAGYYGNAVRRTAQWMLKEQIVDFIGTDLHHERHLEAITQFAARNDLYKITKGNKLKNKELFVSGTNGNTLNTSNNPSKKAAPQHKK